VNILRVRDYASVSEKAKNIVLDRISDFSDTTIALPTGNTPDMMYSLLVKEYQSGKVDFSDVVIFNLDEYVGMDPENPYSYNYYIHNRFLKHVKTERSYVPNGLAEDLDRECEAYEDKIKEEGNLDLALLGIGRNGHIGFNEPGTSFDSLTHVTDLSEDTMEANARFFPRDLDFPEKAITMGLKTIMGAREIILLASGNEKANAIREMILGEVTENLPASILQTHKNCNVIIDGDAASLLGNST